MDGSMDTKHMKRNRWMVGWMDRNKMDSWIDVYIKK